MKAEKKKIETCDFKDKVILMRTDLNVPLDENQNIRDDTRLQACIPTLKYILERGGRVVLLAHMGRPKGKRQDKLSLKHVLDRLSELLGQKVKFVEDCIGESVQKIKQELKPGEVLLTENLRFYEAEENPSVDPTFSEQLAKYCDVYVNDSFSSAHRNHASTAQIAVHFPEKAYMGLSLAQEEKFLKKKLLEPDRPFYAIIGGAKISSKIGVILSLIEKADGLIIGGAMAHTFLKAMGHSIGKSLNEPEYEPKAQEIIKACEIKKIPLLLPLDLVVAPEISENAPAQVVSIDSIPDDQIGVDVGPQTLKLYEETLKQAKTVFWNGPLGVTEIEAFSKGTEALATLLGTLDATTIVGGGDSTAALKKLKLDHKMTYISTGGGASLEYIEKGSLPGIEALSDQN